MIIAKDGGIATVQIYNNPNCLTCKKRLKSGACSSCSDYDESSTSRVLALNGDCVEVGDLVDVVASKAQKMLLSLVSFVIPVVCAALTYLVTSTFTDDAQVMARSAVATAIIAVIIAGIYSYRISKNTCDYKIVSIIEKDEN